MIQWGFMLVPLNKHSISQNSWRASAASESNHYSAHKGSTDTVKCVY